MAKKAAKRCRYCDRSMARKSDASYRENPFCKHCLHERIAKAAEEDAMTRGQFKLVHLGNGWSKWEPVSMGG